MRWFRLHGLRVSYSNPNSICIGQNPSEISGLIDGTTGACFKQACQIHPTIGCPAERVKNVLESCTRRQRKISNLAEPFQAFSYQSESVVCDGEQYLNSSSPSYSLGMRVKAAIYARVSLKDGRQDVDNQLRLLRDYAQREGLEVVKEYVDHATGGNGNRDQFKAMFDGAIKHRFS